MLVYFWHTYKKKRHCERQDIVFAFVAVTIFLQASSCMEKYRKTDPRENKTTEKVYATRDKN